MKKVLEAHITRDVISFHVGHTNLRTHNFGSEKFRYSLVSIRAASSFELVFAVHW